MSRKVVGGLQRKERTSQLKVDWTVKRGKVVGRTNMMIVMKDWMRDLILGTETSRAREEKSRGVERPGERKEKNVSERRANERLISLLSLQTHLSSTTPHSAR